MTSKITVYAALPIDGEGIERLNVEQYTDNIRAHIEENYPVNAYHLIVEAMANDGTIETSVHVSDPQNWSDTELAELTDVVSEAESDAFCDKSSYDGALA